MKFETGDIVIVKHQNISLKFVVMKQDGKYYLYNPATEPIELTIDNCSDFLETVVEVWRGEERVYPNGILTKDEKAELNALSRYFTDDTCVTKVTEGLTGVTSYIRVSGLASARHGRENVDLPSFLSGQYYKGLNSNVSYPIKELMRN